MGQQTIQDDGQAPVPDNTRHEGQQVTSPPVSPDSLLPDLPHILLVCDLHPQGVVEAGGLASVHTELEEPVLTRH